MNYLRRAEEKKEEIFEALYLMLLAVYTILSLKDTTQIPYVWSEGLVTILRILGLLVVTAKMAVGRRWKLGEAILCCFVCGCLIKSWSVCHRTYILELAILIAGAYQVPFRKIAQVYLSVSLAGLLVTMLLAGTGRIENLIYYRQDGKARIAFGFIYPTDFTAHIFYLAAVYAWLRERRITYGEIGGIALLAGFCYHYCDARLNTSCLLILAAGLLYVKIRRSLARKSGQEYGMHRVLRGFLCLSAPLCAAGILLLTQLYGRGNGLALWVDQMLSNRLGMSWQAFQQFPITRFGQSITMWGLGGTTEFPANYFFLDSSYVNILFTMGWMVLAAVLILLVGGAVRESRLRRWEHLGILAVAALQCMVEHHLIQISYHPFLLLLFAAAAETAPRWKLFGKGQGGEGHE